MFIQYQNSSNFVSLLNQLSDYLLIPIDQFYNHFFNIKTADTQGLDNWGLILNQIRTIQVPDYTSIVGFNNGVAPVPLDTGYPQNFNYGGFISSATTTQTLTNDQYRAVLQLLYFKYTVDCSVKSCIDVANIYIQEQYNDPSLLCSITEHAMYYTYDFNFTLQPFEITLFKQNDLLPRPAGIKYNVTWTV